MRAAREVRWGAIARLLLAEAVRFGGVACRAHPS